MTKLIIFTNTYPYGTGETFLHEELPFVAQKFSKVIIFPLYIPGGTGNIGNIALRPIPGNVIVKRPLIDFDHKDKMMLLINGIMPRFPIEAIKEFFSRKVFSSGKKLWIFLNYTLLRNSVINNRSVIKDVTAEIKNSTAVYMYWGDKSALIIPYIKKRLKHAPKFIVRFHGSDLYEEAKGYIPYRKSIYKNTDYAVPISNNGAEYIKQNYPDTLPDKIKVHKLGSHSHCMPETIPPATEFFHIVSCSNVIELKRVDMIAKALLKIEQDIPFIERMAEAGYKKIKWTHIGDGPLLEKVKGLFKTGTSVIFPNFTGNLSHDKVMEYYSTHRTELFIQVSRSEGIPVSVMEALSFGTPVIATNVGGVGELFGCIGENNGGTAVTTGGKCTYGTLLAPDVTIEQLEKAIKGNILLPDKKQEEARSAARMEWEKNWNSEKNYSGFAEFLSNINT